MECPNCKKGLKLPPESVMSQMGPTIKRRCGGCGCHVQLDQITQEVTISWDPSKDEK